MVESWRRWSVILGGSRGVAGAAIVLIGLAAFTGCRVNTPVQAQKGASGPAAVPVVTGTASQRSVPVTLLTIGTVEPSATVEVRAMIGGQLQKVHFKEGDFVQAGDILFSLDRRPFEAAVRQAEANLAKSLAELDNARRNAERSASLVREGLIERQAYEQMSTTEAALEATVKANEAALETAKVNLGYATIRAPISGRTGDLMVDEGNLVQANNVALVTIHQLSPIEVRFAVPEHYLAAIQGRMAQGTVPVTARVPDGEGPPAEGALAFVDNTVDRATGTIRLKASFPNDDHRLWPGQFVQTAVLLKERPEAVVVAAQAVQTGQEGPYVYIVKPDSTVEVRQVVTSDLVEGNLLVVEQGLQPGETVVTDGQLRLLPGSKVRVQEESATEKASES